MTDTFIDFTVSSAASTHVGKLTRPTRFLLTSAARNGGNHLFTSPSENSLYYVVNREVGNTFWGPYDFSFDVKELGSELLVAFAPYG